VLTEVRRPDGTIDLTGRTPENWSCIDCGYNTAPGMLGRVELEKAIDANPEGIEQSIDANSEVYTVSDAVWARAGMEPMGGCLCIGCLEKRIGRKLKPKDFDHSSPFNRPDLPGTERLLDRRGRAKGQTEGLR
jgi:hypothetical protein